MFSADGDFLCDGHAARSTWTTWTVHCVFIQRSAQVQNIPQRPLDLFFFVFKTLPVQSEGENYDIKHHHCWIKVEVMDRMPSCLVVCCVLKTSVMFFVFFCLYLAQHHLFCFQLFGHRDDGRPHQATLPRHDGGESDPAVQSIR